MKRSFLCPKCGAMRRENSKSHPRCHRCGGEMVELSTERAQAAHKLRPQQRVRWFTQGARYRRGNGRKRWVPIMGEK